MLSNEDNLKQEISSRLADRLVEVKSEIERVSRLMAFVLPSDKLQKKAERVETKPEPEVS